MPIAYPDIQKAVMLRANQIGDAADAAALETLFTSALATAVEGLEVPLTALKLTVLAVEKLWVERIAMFGSINYKQALYGRSNDQGSGAVPTQDNAAKEFIGGYIGIFDSVETTIQLTEQPEHVVRRAIRANSRIGGPFKTQKYYYHLRGNQILHNRTGGAFFAGCSWSRSAQSTAYDAGGNSPLPQSLEVGFVAEILTNLPQENWFVPEARYYADIVQEVIASMRGGVEPTAQLPDSTASAEPIKN